MADSMSLWDSLRPVTLKTISENSQNFNAESLSSKQTRVWAENNKLHGKRYFLSLTEGSHAALMRLRLTGTEAEQWNTTAEALDFCQGALISDSQPSVSHEALWMYDPQPIKQEGCSVGWDGSTSSEDTHYLAVPQGEGSGERWTRCQDQGLGC